MMTRHLNPTHQRAQTSTATHSVGSYKSPKHKLVKFFEKSRNQWKAKCLEAKTVIKRLQNRIRFLEKSKDQLKHRVNELEADLNALNHLLQTKDDELEQLKKKTIGRPLLSIQA
jgi:chromosome segregation ATPase